MVSLTRMWEDTFEGITGIVKLKSSELKSKTLEMSRISDESSGVDEGFLEKKDEVKLECPICFEPFDMSHNAPLVLWCGHTLCKSCVLRLQRAVLKFQNLHPIILPFFVSCPWCSSFSMKLTFRGNLKFPKKNYFVLWMVDSSQNASRTTSNNLSCVGTNGKSRSKELSGSNQEERALTSTLCEAWALLRFLWNFFSGYSRKERVLGLALLVIFVALYAAQVSTFLLTLYALTVLFGSAFLLLPKLCLPGIGLAV